jgi:hypothetical protein
MQNRVCTHDMICGREVSPTSYTVYGLPHRVACGRDDLLTHNMTFLPENPSPQEKKPTETTL